VFLDHREAVSVETIAARRVDSEPAADIDDQEIP
jgi:hypothetical protein